jgi:hypothetical protein
MHGRIFFSGFLLAFVTLLFASCGPLTRTTGASFTDPAYQGRTFPSFVVKVEGSPLAERQVIETSLAAGLNKAGLHAEESINLLPPTRDFTDSQIRKKIAGTGRSALLVVIPQQKQIMRDFVPGSYTPGNIIAYPVGHGRVAHVREPGFYEPGYYTHEPVATYNASLYALPGFDKVWTADLQTEGPNGMAFLIVGQNFADALIQRLAQDGLIYLPVK